MGRDYPAPVRLFPNFDVLLALVSRNIDLTDQFLFKQSLLDTILLKRGLCLLQVGYMASDKVVLFLGIVAC